MLNDLYFKTTCNIRPHFLRHMGGLKIEGPVYFKVQMVDYMYCYIGNCRSSIMSLIVAI